MRHVSVAAALLLAFVSCVPYVGPRVCTTMPATRCTFDAVPAGWQSAGPLDTMPTVPFVDIERAALLCSLAYALDDARIRQLGDVTIRELDTVMIPDVKASRFLFGIKYFIWRDDSTKRQYVSIRGTLTLENWIEDALYTKVEDSVLNGYVHLGAYFVMLRMKDDIRSHLVDTMPVWLCGHSLGGAVATLTALHWVAEDSLTLGPVYTFGQMHTYSQDVACNGWARCVPIIRCVNWNDPVPHLPPALKPSSAVMHPGYKGTYRHLGDELILRSPPQAWLYRTDQHEGDNLDAGVLAGLDAAVTLATGGAQSLEQRLRAQKTLHLMEAYWDRVVSYRSGGVKPFEFRGHPRTHPCGGEPR